jgi:hypothetical protein
MAIPDFQMLILHRPRLASLGKPDLHEQTATRRFAFVKFRLGKN